MAFRLYWLLLAVFLVSCSGGSDSEKSASTALSGTFTAPKPVQPVPGSAVFAYEPYDAVDRLAVSETPSSKAQTINLKGSVIPFTATAGHMIAYDWESAPPKPVDLARLDAQAAIFYTAYTRDDLPRETRPVTFVFNGGPGGSSADLDLDFLGPKKIDTVSPELRLLDNPDTLLDKTDLVFVDPVGTGYSTAIRPYENADFWGVDSDAKVLRDFITRYINLTGRQSSPKYIYGLSYGGMRAPIIGRRLIESGSRDYTAGPDGKPANILAGLILNSPMLNFKTDCRQSNVSCGGALPTYAMVAAYHGKPAGRQDLTAEDLKTADPASVAPKIARFLSDVRTFAITFNSLYLAVFPGVSQAASGRIQWDAYLKAPNGFVSDAGQPNAEDFLNRLYTLTGIGKPYQKGNMSKDNPWIETPNLNPMQFLEKFDPARGKLVINDGRQFLPRQAIDPSLDRADIYYDFIKTYQAGFMNYRSTSQYLGLNGGVIDNWKLLPDPRLPGAEGRLGTSLPDMAFALTLNPNLKVLIQHGYYDLNTVFHQTELNITRAGLAAKVPVKTYEGGHGVLPGKTRSYERVMQDIDTFYAQPLANMIAALNAPLAAGDSHE